MNDTFSNTDFYNELESSLSGSTEEQRKIWALAIIENNLDLRDLSGLLFCEKKTATRFLWLLGRIGMTSPNKLVSVLPFLLVLSDDLDPAYKTSFANFWLLAGVPSENEGKAIDLMFQWLLSAETNVTIKSRSIFVLFKLTKKYPELKDELKFCLIDQMDKHTADFKKKVVKVLLEMEK